MLFTVFIIVAILLGIALIGLGITMLIKKNANSGKNYILSHGSFI